MEDKWQSTSQLSETYENFHSRSAVSHMNTQPPALNSSVDVPIPINQSQPLHHSTMQKTYYDSLADEMRLPSGQHQKNDEPLLPDENLCFVCSSPTSNKGSSVKVPVKHSHAPLIVLLVDVLGYKLEDTKLHSQVVCDSCHKVLNTIDEMQQILTESKTDIRTKFLETLQRLNLKYPRTDKMLKPRCSRCAQTTQTSVKRNARTRQGRGAEAATDKKLKSGHSKDHLFPSNSDGPSSLDKDSGRSMAIENLNDDEPNLDAVKVLQSKECTSKLPSNLVYDTDPAFFSTEEKLKVGYCRENESLPASFHCLCCNSMYDSAISLKMHVRVYHLPVLVYDNGTGTPESRYRMGIKLQNVIPSELSTSEKPFSCLFCDSSYKLQSSLQLHFRENHSPHKPFECMECKECFRKPIELSRHRAYRCMARKTEYSIPKR